MTSPAPVMVPEDARLPEQVTVTVPPATATESEVLAALVSALIAGAAIEMIAKILSRFAGLTPRSVAAVFRIMLPQWRQLIEATANDLAVIPRDESPASKVLLQLATVNVYRRAAYLVNATRRLAPAALADQEQALLAARREDRYLDAHIQAEHNRAAAAARVVESLATQAGTADTGEPLLGWTAVLDDRTTPECRSAHGRNFNPTIRPPIGYPGEVHIHCRCRPRRPWRTGKRVETIAPRGH